MEGGTKKFFAFLFLIGLAIGSVYTGHFYGFKAGEESVVCKVCAPEDIDFSLFWEVHGLIKELHVDKDNFNDQELIYGAIRGMLNATGDPYTVFMTEEEADIFIDDVSGSFGGIGIEIAIKDKQLTIISPLEGTPGFDVGLKSGDIVTEVDGVSTYELSLDGVISLMRGEEGTEVVLKIYREDWGEERDVSIIRAIINIPVMSLEFKEDNIAYIKLYHFYDTVRYEFPKIVHQISISDADKIILDLRNNPGGYLEISRDVAGFFLEDGQVVVVEDYPEGNAAGENGEEQKDEVHRANGNSILKDYPLVVLINEGSASASEILAGALRDNRGIKLIGETSFGKGSVQRLEELKMEEGATLKVTIAKWLTPNGDYISEKGLDPDIVVEFTEDDFNNDLDPQLDKAIEIIKNF